MNTLYTLSLHNAICQLPLCKARKRKLRKKNLEKKKDCALVIIIMHYKVKENIPKMNRDILWKDRQRGKTKL